MITDKIKSDPNIERSMKSIYDEFLISDQRGFKAIEKHKSIDTLSHHLFRHIVIEAIARKLHKLSIEFAGSDKISKLETTFFYQNLF